MGTLEAVELGHAREVTRLGHNYALFYFDLFVRKIPKYIGLLGLDLFQCHTEAVDK